MNDSNLAYREEVLGYHHGQTSVEASLYKGDELVGYADYTLFSKNLYIDYIFIKPQFRRSGFGSFLMKRIIEENPGYKYKESLKTELGAKFKLGEMKIVRESIEFFRGKDPRRSIGIGRITKIEEWFREWDPDAEYTVDGDFKITINGNLDVEQKPLEKFPEELKGLTTIKGILALNGTLIESLPEITSVEVDLYLNGSRIKTLPEGLSVGGLLDLRGTPIEKLPEDLSVEAIRLEGSSIKELPEGFSVVGSLNLSNTPIKELPSGLYVGQHLNIRGTAIRSLPPDLVVGGEIYKDF